MSEKIQSINPATGKLIQEFSILTDQQLEDKVQLANETFTKLKKTTIEQRTKWMMNVANLLEKNAEKYGKTITMETGKTCK